MQSEVDQPMLIRAVDWIGAHRVTGWELHERARAIQRFVVCAVVLAVDASLAATAMAGLPLWFLVAGIAYGLASLWFARSLRSPSPRHAAVLYAFLFVDPFALLGTIAVAPTTFVFLTPLVLVATTGPGVRYGSRALNVTLVLSAAMVLGMFATSGFWHREPQWSAALVLALVLAPLFFWIPIRRIHDVRRIEEDRAVLGAKNDAVRERAAFLSKVSHELRSPLQSMVSSLDVLEMRHRDAARGDTELISRMRRASLLLNTQLRDLLTLAKGEAGKLEVRPEAFEAAELVQAMAEAARPLAISRGLGLVVQVPDEPVFVVADSSRIDQILTNLVVNAVRYTDRGTVNVVLHRFDASLRRLEFTVADTGSGIPDAELATLLNPEHSGATTARRGEGSGIGLAIVRILVGHLGGDITVSSRLGVGTVFRIVIPVELPEAVWARPDPAASAVAGRADPDRLPTRVLVVDDRADVLHAIAGVIDELGCACDRASTVDEAADLLASRPYALVLLDLDLPGRDGVAIAHEIRRGVGLNARARLIAMTAGDRAPEGRTPMGAPFDGWLTKPLDLHALRRAILGPDRDGRPSQPTLFADAPDVASVTSDADRSTGSTRR